MWQVNPSFAKVRLLGPFHLTHLYGTVLHFSKNTVQVPRLVHRILKHRDKLWRDPLNFFLWVPAIAFCQNVAMLCVLLCVCYAYILYVAAPLRKRMPWTLQQSTKRSRPSADDLYNYVPCQTALENRSLVQLVIRPQHAGACNACAGGKKAHFGAEATCESFGVSPVVAEESPWTITQKFQLLELQRVEAISSKQTPTWKSKHLAVPSLPFNFWTMLLVTYVRFPKRTETTCRWIGQNTHLAIKP